MKVRAHRKPRGVPWAVLAIALGVGLSACGGGSGGAGGTSGGVAIANAGPDQVARVGTAVMLDGRASFATGGGGLAYQWSQTEGPAVVFLTAPHSALPNLVPSVAGAYEFELQVTPASGGASATDRVVVTAIVDGQPILESAPAAELYARDLTHAIFLSSEPATFPAPPPTVSFADGAVTPVAIVDLASDPLDDPAPQAIAGLLRIDEVVSGSLFASMYVPPRPDDPEALEVVFEDGARAPVRAFGTVGVVYSLDGTRSHDDGAIATFRWRHLTGSLDLETTIPFFEVVPSLSQTYEWELEVTDDVGLVSFPRRVKVPVVPAGVPLVGPPLAKAVVRAGAETVVVGGAVAYVSEVGRTIALDGATSVTFTDGAPVAGPPALSYAWRQLDGPPVVFDRVLAQATFAPSAPGAYEFELGVTDANGVSDAADVWVSVAPAGGEAPVAAVAHVADAVLPPGASTSVAVLFDAGASVGGGPLSYHWTQVAGTPVFVESPSLGHGRVVLSQRGVYEFQLRVFDGRAFSPPATVSFRVR